MKALGRKFKAEYFKAKDAFVQKKHWPLRSISRSEALLKAATKYQEYLKWEGRLPEAEALYPEIQETKGYIKKMRTRIGLSWPAIVYGAGLSARSTLPCPKDRNLFSLRVGAIFIVEAIAVLGAIFVMDLMWKII